MSLPEHPLSTAQAESLAWSTRRVNLWEGSVRAGKTFVSFLAFLGFLATYTGNGQFVIVGRTRDTVYRNLFQPIDSEPSLAFLRPFVQYRQGAATAKILGIVVAVIGANDATSEGQIRGMTVAGCYGDEVSLWPEGFWKQMLARMSPAGARLYGTTNPDSPQHWLHLEILAARAGQRRRWRIFHQTMDDNPGLTPEYRRALAAEYSGLWYKRFILGEWVAAEGAIFDTWDADRHVIPHEQLPPLQRYLGVGIDYGTTNATSAVLLALTAERDLLGRPAPRLAVVDEWRWDPKEHGGQRLAPAAQSVRFRAWLEQQHSALDVAREAQGRDAEPIPFLFRDPAAADFGEQLRLDRVTTHPADNDVTRGIADVANLLTTDRLVISSRAYGVVKEAPAYAWDPKATKEGRDEPLKVGDHSLDALRYAVRSTKGQWSTAMRNAYGRTAVLAA